MNKLFVWLTLFVCLAGCAPQAFSPLGPTGINQIGTELAGPNTFLGQLPVAFVILKPDPANPRSADTPRNRALCTEWVGIPTAAAIQAQDAVAKNIVRTRWLVTADNASAASAADCNFLLANYDLVRANALIQAVQLTSGSFAGQGPFLVLIAGKDVTAIDGSSEPQMQRFVQSWNTVVNRAQQQVATSTRTGSFLDVLFALPRLLVRIIETIFPPSSLIFGTLRGIVC